MTPDASLPPAAGDGITDDTAAIQAGAPIRHFREPWDLRLHDADAARRYCQGRNPDPLPPADDTEAVNDAIAAAHAMPRTLYTDVQRPEPLTEEDLA